MVERKRLPFAQGQDLKTTQYSGTQQLSVMKNTTLNLLAGSLTLLLLLATFATAQDMTGPPERPEFFRNPAELREYLKALNEYYAIVGRPRFGRSAPSGSRWNFVRHSSFADQDLKL